MEPDRAEQDDGPVLPEEAAVAAAYHGHVPPALPAALQPPSGAAALRQRHQGGADVCL